MYVVFPSTVVKVLTDYQGTLFIYREMTIIRDRLSISIMKTRSNIVFNV